METIFYFNCEKWIEMSIFEKKIQKCICKQPSQYWVHGAQWWFEWNSFLNLWICMQFILTASVYNDSSDKYVKSAVFILGIWICHFKAGKGLGSSFLQQNTYGLFTPKTLKRGSIFNLTISSDKQLTRNNWHDNSNKRYSLNDNRFDIRDFLSYLYDW